MAGNSLSDFGQFNGMARNAKIFFTDLAFGGQGLYLAGARPNNPVMPCVGRSPGVVSGPFFPLLEGFIMILSPPFPVVSERGVPVLLSPARGAKAAVS